MNTCRRNNGRIFSYFSIEKIFFKNRKNALNIKTNTNKYIYEKLRTSVTAQRKRKYEAKLVLAISLIIDRENYFPGYVKLLKVIEKKKNKQQKNEQ